MIINLRSFDCLNEFSLTVSEEIEKSMEKIDTEGLTNFTLYSHGIVSIITAICTLRKT